MAGILIVFAYPALSKSRVHRGPLAVGRRRVAWRLQPVHGPGVKVATRQAS